MALNFLKKEINSKKRKQDEMLPPTADNTSQWVTRGVAEKEREKAYLAEQAKIEEEHRAVRQLEPTQNIPQLLFDFLAPMLISCLNCSPTHRKWPNSPNSTPRRMNLELLLAHNRYAKKLGNESNCSLLQLISNLKRV